MRLCILLMGTLFACDNGKDGDTDVTGHDDTGTVTTDTETGDTTDDTGTPPDTDDTDTDTDTETDTSDTSDTAPPVDTDTGTVYDVCSDNPALPIEYTSTSGWSGAEDFTIDGEGYYVSVDESGSLTRRSRDGDEILVRPGLGYAAGIHMMPDGESIVYADVQHNTIVEVNLTDGGAATLLGGLSYPNGIEVGLDGMIYVAEHSGGRVLQLDPKTGVATVLAEGFYAPNGIAFGPDHETLYWNSFGDGSVHSVTRDGDGWTEPVRVGSTPESSTWWDTVIDPCDGAIVGDACYDTDGEIGTCQADGSGFKPGELDCEDVDTGVQCMGREEGDACSHELFGVTIDSACTQVSGPGGGGGGPSLLECPITPPELMAPCEDALLLDACELDGVAGTCQFNWERRIICVDADAEEQKAIDACKGLAKYDGCVVDGNYEPTSGACKEDDKGALACEGEADSSGYSYSGGLDGLNVDECGNVYVTEYVEGNIWMFPLGESQAELVVELPSYWIPNLHWGNGVGGWETDTLYVAERGYGSGSGSKVFELLTIVEGSPEAFTPELSKDTGSGG